jgi:hypothetical protein
VRLEPGENVVHFRFGSAWFGVLTMLFAIDAACWIVGVGWMAAISHRPSHLTSHI